MGRATTKRRGYRTVTDSTELAAVLTRAPEQGVGRGLYRLDRIAATWELTDRGMSARTIAGVLSCTSRTVVRYRNMRQES